MSTDLGVEFWGSVLDSSLLMDKENLPLALFVFVSTLYAFSYLRFKTCPISWKGANWRQQVLTVQVPDTPWHLHLVFTWPFTTCKTKLFDEFQLLNPTINDCFVCTMILVYCFVMWKICSAFSFFSKKKKMKGVVDTISKIKCLTWQIWYFYINIFDSNCKDIPSYEMMLNNLVCYKIW